ncbi:hypothetical protein SDRG_03776 [Saprolegnia diclina VS20]|uniref:PH domain-containing protein n=1 Tax=Saprolegnia diclina (strain VS20) TaxID=1156394 RepID=T0S7S2_SAPDV|nr:hypothetical protein SDRG_03776 [Saprolegnia diclina VS20]EQC38817.1 hypothetical protein SDRG_03776 [Saprolegnia diclina VS20]|eukprot:XP_008607641.1 hypothetical protein SDRG_03776 [Saprolegnia diclina VS20]
MSHSGHGEWGHFVALTPTRDSYLEARGDLKERLLTRSPLPSPVLRPLRLSRKTGCLYNLSALDDQAGLPASKPTAKMTLHAAIYPSMLCPRSEPREVQRVPSMARQGPPMAAKTGILVLPATSWWASTTEVRVVLEGGRVAWVPVTPRFEPIAAARTQSLVLTPRTVVCRMRDASLQLTSEHGATVLFRCPSPAACKAWVAALTRAIVNASRIPHDPIASAPIRILPSMRSR